MGKNRAKKIMLLVQSIVFLVLVVVLGIVSAAKYADFRLNDRVDYNEWTVDLGTKLETDIGTTFFQKFGLVNLNGAIRTFAGQDYMNQIYKLQNGYLTRIHAYETDGVLTALADNIAAVNRFLSGMDVPMLFIMAPFSVGKYDPQLPNGVEDYTNDNADRFVALLRERGVTVLDTRDTMHEDGIDHYDMMYKTDHHWNTSAGFYTYRKIEPWLSDAMQCALDIRVSDPEQYTVQTWPEWHLGSYGQRTGIYYGGVDDFTLYIPNFETLIQHAGEESSGPLQTIFYHMEPLQEKDYTSRLTYDDVLGGGDLYGETYVNHFPAADKRILLVSNSYYRAIYPYLLMQFREVRYKHTSTTSSLTPEHMTTNAYDAVIMLYEPTLLWEGCSAFEFSGY